MDIKKIMDVGSSVSPVTRREREKPGGLDFKELLRQASPGPESLGQTTSSLSPHGDVEPLSAMAFVMPNAGEISRTRLQSIEATENTLSLLEEYQKAMSDPNLSLKKVDPLVQSLSKELDGLNVLSERLSPSDPLQKILTEVGVVSRVEIERFRRGDYI
jgi:hypothetical protein